MKFTMFRESSDGPVSMRRVLAAFFAAASVPLGIIPFGYAGVGWAFFIPFGISVAASILLLFFTTWADVAALVRSAKGDK